MNYDIEGKLTRFELLKPSQELRSRLLSRVEMYQAENIEMSATFKLGIKIYFAAAACILISIMIFNTLTYDSRKLDPKQRKYIEQAIELGLPKESAVYTVAILRSNPKPILTEELYYEFPPIFD